MRGLLIKALRETWLATLLFGAGLSLAMGLLTYILPQVQANISDVLAKMPFVKTLVQAIVGADLGEQINARMMQSILWVHPVVLTLAWGHQIVVCTRVPAGEIDRGTIDILLGLPVSRRTVYLSESAAWLLSGTTVLLLGLLGHLITAPAMSVDVRPDRLELAIIMLNFWCVYVGVGGLTLFVSAMSDRRGHAIAVVFAIVLASFLLNFLAQFWEPAKRIVFLSVMDYYRPAEILQSRSVPVADIATLLVVGGAAWVLGGLVFSRRSICTV